jgi:hypothetical protein
MSAEEGSTVSTQRPWSFGLRAAACSAGLLLGACATTGAQQKAAPNPIDIQRGWKIYTMGPGDVMVGMTTIPSAPADTTRPDKILDAIADAFCTPVRDEKNQAVDQRLKDYCGGAARVPGRVVLAPDWSAEVPSYPACFIHCVCEGRAPRTDDPSELARESKTGPCTNRLNCRLDCPGAS